jgi:ADP-ribose pyrophosphatase YjhB (NUDIX family)
MKGIEMSTKAFCQHCGGEFPSDIGWPRTCGHCGQTTWRNPLPVAVLLVPSGQSLVGIRRANTKAEGKLALVGGYVNFGESWRAASAREAKEEAGLDIDADAIILYDVVSAPDGTILIFGIAPPVEFDKLPEFIPNEEASERVRLFEHSELAFPIHERIVRRFLSARRPYHDEKEYFI